MNNPRNTFRAEHALLDLDGTVLPLAEQPLPAGDARDAASGGPGRDDPEDRHDGLRFALPRIRVDVFVSDDVLVSAARQAAGDRRASKSEFAIRQGGFADAVEAFKRHAPGDIVVIEDASHSNLEQKIEALADVCPSGTRLLLIGCHNDIALYRRMLRVGVSDYLSKPVGPLDLLDALLSICADEQSSGRLGMAMAFLGARGGVGSSTIAQSVAALLSEQFQATTLLVDADIGFGTAALQLDIASAHTLSDAVKEHEDLDADVLERLVFWRSKRLGLLASPERPDQVLASEAGTMPHIVEQARRLAKFVVLDLPQGWTPWTVEGIVAADRIGLVATPDLPSLRNTRNLFDLISKLRPNDEPPHLILNRVPVRGRPQVSPAEFVRTLEREIAVQIPVDSGFPQAEMAGGLLVEKVPSSPAAAAIAGLGSRMAGRQPIVTSEGRQRGLFGRLLAPAARLKRRRATAQRTAGTATVEFAIIAPVLILAVLSVADIGLEIHQSFEIDEALRNGAQAALQDPGEANVQNVLSATDAGSNGQSLTSWTVGRYCACPANTATQVNCYSTCSSNLPPDIFYSVSGSRKYSGFMLPARDLVRSAVVRVR